MAKDHGIGPIEPRLGYTMPMVAEIFGKTVTWVRRELAQKGEVPFTPGKDLCSRATTGRHLLTWIESNLDAEPTLQDEPCQDEQDE